MEITKEKFMILTTFGEGLSEINGYTLGGFGIGKLDGDWTLFHLDKKVIVYKLNCQLPLAKKFLKELNETHGDVDFEGVEEDLAKLVSFFVNFNEINEFEIIKENCIHEVNGFREINENPLTIKVTFDVDVYTLYVYFNKDLVFETSSIYEWQCFSRWHNAFFNVLRDRNWMDDR